MVTAFMLVGGAQRCSPGVGRAGKPVSTVRLPEPCPSAVMGGIVSYSGHKFVRETGRLYSSIDILRYSFRWAEQKLILADYGDSPLLHDNTR